MPWTDAVHAFRAQMAFKQEADARVPALQRTALAFYEGRRPEDTFFAGLGDAKRKLAGTPSKAPSPGRTPATPMTPAHQTYAANVAQVRSMRGAERGTRPTADVLQQKSADKAKERESHAAQQSAAAKGANRDAGWKQQNAGWLKRLNKSADNQVAQARGSRRAAPGDKTATVPPPPRRKAWDEPTRPSVR